MKKNEFSGLTVLDLSRYLPGGYATQVLADMGAEVIKVEDTARGDFCRYDEPGINGVSYYFTALGRNKKSLSVNLKSDEGKEIFYRLARKADVILESFRPGVTNRLGIGYQQIREIKPDIIYCSLSGYGQFHPSSLKALHDINMQAQSGYLSLNGGKTSPLHLCDLASGKVAAQAILAALYQRSVSGKGNYIDISMFDSFVWWNSMLDSRYYFYGRQLEAKDLEYPAVCYNIYDTSDGGKIAVGMVEEKFWKEFCRLTDAPELVPVQMCRRHEAPEAFARMEGIMASKTLKEWEEWLGDKDLCMAPVLNKDQAVSNILKQENGLIEYHTFPGTGKVLQTNIPHKMSNLPLSLDEALPPPVLGEHTLDQLTELGYTGEQAKELAEKGVIRLSIKEE